LACYPAQTLGITRKLRFGYVNQQGVLCNMTMRNCQLLLSQLPHVIAPMSAFRIARAGCF